MNSVNLKTVTNTFVAFIGFFMAGSNWLIQRCYVVLSYVWQLLYWWYQKIRLPLCIASSQAMTRAIDIQTKKLLASTFGIRWVLAHAVPSTLQNLITYSLWQYVGHKLAQQIDTHEQHFVQLVIEKQLSAEQKSAYRLDGYCCVRHTAEQLREHMYIHAGIVLSQGAARDRLQGIFSWFDEVVYYPNLSKAMRIQGELITLNRAPRNAMRDA